MSIRKILFYFPYESNLGADPAAVLDGTVPASGTAVSIRLGLAFKRRGYEVEVIHHVPDIKTESHGVALRFVPNVPGAAEIVRLHGAETVVILPPHKALDLLSLIKSSDSIKLIWMHNNSAIDWMDAAFKIGADRAICVTRTAARMYRPFGFNDKVEIIPYSLREALDLPRVAVDSNKVCFVGALVESKGFHHVLRAWPHVLREFPSARLHVFGSATLHDTPGGVGSTGLMTQSFEESYWQPFLKTVGGCEKGQVVLHGALSKQELFQCISSAAVGIVNPNVRDSTETFCMSAIEMQAAGVPCIGGGAGGLLDTIAHGKSGFHLKSQDPLELARKVVKVLAGPDLRNRLSSGALAHAATFRSSDKEVEAFEGVVERVRAGHGAPRPDFTGGDLLRILGFGALKLAVKRRVRPDSAAMRCLSGLH